jgi:hypothetical protein
MMMPGAGAGVPPPQQHDAIGGGVGGGVGSGGGGVGFGGGGVGGGGGGGGAAGAGGGGGGFVPHDPGGQGEDNDDAEAPPGLVTNVTLWRQSASSSGTLAGGPPVSCVLVRSGSLRLDSCNVVSAGEGIVAEPGARAMISACDISAVLSGRGLHWSNFQLNLSRF